VSTLLRFLHNLPNVLLQIANKMGLKKMKQVASLIILVSLFYRLGYDAV
jgi:hypothetical protein